MDASTIGCGAGLVALGGCVAVAARCLSRSVFGLERELAPTEVWSVQGEEDAVEPDLAIFDAHHHLWDFKKHDKGLPALIKLLLTRLKPDIVMKLLEDKKLVNSFGKRSPLLAPFMAKELLKDVRGHGKKGHKIIGTMYMECGWKTPGVEECMEPVGEAAMVTEVHRQNPTICQGIVAFANLSLGASVEPALMEYKKNPLVKGIRYGLAWADDPTIHGNDHASKDTAYDPKFREGFALLSKYGFTYDSWHFHENLEGFIDLAKTFPGTTMICDHLGFPLGIGKYDKAATLPVWKELMKKLAQCKNVNVKIGGLGMRFCGYGFDERDTPASSDELAEAWGPYVCFCINTFGVDRCMMESNFPMDRITCTYTVLFNALKKIVSHYSKADKQKLFELNALRIYGVKL